MPMFIFLSGYLTKNVEKARDKAFDSLYIPFVFFNSLYMMASGKLVFPFLQPVGPMWYLFALFAYKMLLKDIIRIRHNLLVTFALSILASFIPFIKSNSGISEIVIFFPFFLLGFYCKREYLVRVKTGFKKKISACVLLVLSVVVTGILIGANNYQFTGSLFYMTADVSIHGVKIIIFEVCLYLFAIALSICILTVTPLKANKILTKIGRNSFSVYICHSFVSLLMSMLCSEIYKFNSNEALRFAVVLVMAAVCLVFFSNETFARLFKRIINNISRVMCLTIL